MSTTKVTLQDGTYTETLLIRNARVPDVLKELEDGPQNEVDVLRNFLEKTGIDLVVERPNSSWISEIRFSQANGELTFVVADDQTGMAFDATLEDYIAGVKTGEAGRWYHRLHGTYGGAK